MSIERILALAAGQPWALMPEKVAEVQMLLELRASGMRFSPAEIEARVGPGRTGQSAAAPSGVAVISIFGIMSQRANMMADLSSGGGTSTEKVGASLRQWLADPDTRAIVLEIDSPGGGTFGTGELADQIFKARGQKPIIAQVNSVAASAAYWVATAASEIVMTPGGEVGSIGVYGSHTDMSAMLEKQGLKKTYISAGEYKTEGHPFAPLSEEARAYQQGRVNAVYDDFVRAVARGRNTTPARVKAEFGKGRTVGAREALRLGMVDRIGTMQETLRRLGVGGTAPAARGLAPLGALAASASHQDELRLRRHRIRMLGSG